MVYEKNNWEDGPAGGTPISKSRLNHLETQYDEAKDYADENFVPIGGVGVDPVLTAAKAALFGVPMVSQGHSFMVGSGVQSPNKWAELFAQAMDLTYPTLATTGDLMRAVGGSAAEEITQRAFGGSAAFIWTPGDQYPLIMETLINTSRRTGSVPAARTGALHAMRGMVALAGSTGAAKAGDPRFTYSSGWNTTSVAASMSKTVSSIPAAGAATVNVTFEMPSATAYVLILSRNASIPGCQVQIDDLTSGKTLATFDNTNTAAADTPGTYITIPIRIKAPIGNQIRVTSPTRAGNFIFDGLLMASPNPAPVFVMKEPYLNDYSLSTTYPNGSDATFDYFNSVHDELAAEFGNVIVADPNAAGYWDKTTMIQSDGVHPNELGSVALANTMIDAVEVQLPKILARRALGLA